MGLDNEVFNSGKLAKLAGVSPDTLRHYERKGVLARPRRATNGYREYPADALNRVRLIRRALAVGLTLDELANILRVRDGGGAPCHEVRSLAALKLSEVEKQIEDLTAFRDELRKTLKDWDQRLAGKKAGTRAYLLEAFAANATSETKSARRYRSPLKPKRHKEKQR